MATENKQRTKRPASHELVALGLIILGFLFLLDNFDVIEIGSLWRFWPLILIFIGIVKLKSEAPEERSSAWTFLVLGGLFMLTNFHILHWHDIWHFWPVVLIVVGLSILLRHRSGGTSLSCCAPNHSPHFVQASAIFGENDKTVTSDAFEGGNVTTLFGETKVDLGKCALADGENVLHLTTMFGGTEITVPRDWNVVIKAVPVFGGFEDLRINVEPDKLSQDRKLIIKGLILFGGFKLKEARA